MRRALLESRTKLNRIRWKMVGRFRKQMVARRGPRLLKGRKEILLNKQQKMSKQS